MVIEIYNNTNCIFRIEFDDALDSYVLLHHPPDIKDMTYHISPTIGRIRL